MIDGSDTGEVSPWHLSEWQRRRALGRASSWRRQRRDKETWSLGQMLQVSHGSTGLLSAYWRTVLARWILGGISQWRMLSPMCSNLTLKIKDVSVSNKENCIYLIAFCGVLGQVWVETSGEFIFDSCFLAKIPWRLHEVPCSQVFSCMFSLARIIMCIQYCTRVYGAGDVWSQQPGCSGRP